MTVVSVVPDQQARTLTLTAEYSAAPEDVWQLWADPRRLERWWGPPAFPATVEEHDLRAGGRVTYVMTGPAGETFHGWWAVTDVTAPSELTFDDAFGKPDEPPTDMPVSHSGVTISDAGEGTTRMVITTSFDSVEAMQQLVAMGMQEGLTEAVGQTDALLPVRH